MATTTARYLARLAADRERTEQTAIWAQFIARLYGYYGYNDREAIAMMDYWNVIKKSTGM